MPAYPTIASRFNDPGVNRLFAALVRAIEASKIGTASWRLGENTLVETAATPPALIPGARIRYLSEIAEGARAAAARIEQQAQAATPRLWAAPGA